ncbi:hypothetical protein CW751_10700 [Brumimicrobium salinarum]|uniref:Uncharacterized protein n=1 Tax=Brumimicrobium salinarum TaxID=2058658 RepID=A0A2I0R144_9FLAO|nr:heavy-metal-associated domain-containing protein [Brumimicrobium salinarum]PKR80312.1 hypothetical protein CW751_10700 [Brumimicrobium salinarum]
MRNILSFILFTVIIVSCSEQPVLIDNKEVQEEQVKPTHIATFEVEGMMCQKGCGAAIRKGLIDAGGVSTVEVDFKESDPKSEINVYFDSDQTNTEQMLTVIGSLAEMRYSAKLVKITESKITKAIVEGVKV